mmetsp:Transcript_78798/g.206850  ORF Transcript_78798/g.206850 Transcript_78798/m.206850 type:complete len:242 (-) Transcript_78798:197-922(-)
MRASVAKTSSFSSSFTSGVSPFSFLGVFFSPAFGRVAALAFGFRPFSVSRACQSHFLFWSSLLDPVLLRSDPVVMRAFLFFVLSIVALRYAKADVVYQSMDALSLAVPSFSRAPKPRRISRASFTELGGSAVIFFLYSARRPSSFSSSIFGSFFFSASLCSWTSASDLGRRRFRLSISIRGMPRLMWSAMEGRNFSLLVPYVISAITGTCVRAETKLFWKLSVVSVEMFPLPSKDSNITSE